MQWDVFTKLSTVQVQIHWIAALCALVLGAIVLIGKKGTKTHRTIGRVYVAAMVVTSVSAFFVRSLEPGEQWHIARNFSWIHLLIPFTLFYLTLAIVYIRKGRVKDHSRSMIFTYIGGILVAGAFTFLPGRHMHTLFFGDPVEVQQKIERGLKH